MTKCIDCDPPLFAEVESVVGVTSRTWRTKDGSDQNMHWLLFDVDNKNVLGTLLRWLRNINLYGYPVQNYMYMTPSGFHLIIYVKHSLKDAYELMLKAPGVDKKYVARGFERGYWFLDSHGKRDFPVEMEYMRVKRSAKGLR